ncbi:isochorismate synthase [Muriicola sp.]|uniref:isochorismate synthase n=1 Tax=Muriicola sp. TaxID=2020856 RepID=UPI003561FE26
MPSPKNNTLTSLLGQVAKHWSEKKPFALFRYPDEAVVKAILQEDGRLHTLADLKRPGFVVSPFGQDRPAFTILPDRTAEATIYKTISRGSTPAAWTETEEEATRYKDLVHKAVKTIRKGILRKVVLSRPLEVPTGKSALEIFEAILASYPSAFCYCWFHPEVGCWLGATPETLVRFSKGAFTTVALAGTMEKEEGKEPAWGLKEKEEQGMVTDYIVEVLSEMGVKTKSSAVETVGAGNLWHLRTTLSGKATAEQLAEVIRALHPTPAVCGIPLQEARNFIEENEGYSRGYYTGYLGELHGDKEGETRLFVNLRCMEFLGDRARIFVGGGITASSDAGKEWDETRAKSQTVLKVL